jgi:hypothetical protein
MLVERVGGLTVHFERAQIKDQSSVLIRSLDGSQQLSSFEDQAHADCRNAVAPYYDQEDAKPHWLNREEHYGQAQDGEACTYQRDPNYNSAERVVVLGWHSQWRFDRFPLPKTFLAANLPSQLPLARRAESPEGN